MLPEPGMFRWREARVPVRVMRSRKVSGLHIWGYRSRNCWAREGFGGAGSGQARRCWPRDWHSGDGPGTAGFGEGPDGAGYRAGRAIGGGGAVAFVRG